MSTTIPEKFIRERDLADLLDVSDSWLQKGRIYGYGPPFIKLRSGRGGVRYRKRDVEKWLETSSSRPEPD